MTSWTIRLSNQAHEDSAWFRRKDRALYSKCFDLTIDTLAHPTSGLGKPEHLHGAGRNIWSRRVNDEHRMIYQIADREIVVLGYKGHYR